MSGRLQQKACRVEAKQVTNVRSARLVLQVAKSECMHCTDRQHDTGAPDSRSVGSLN